MVDSRIGNRVRAIFCLVCVIGAVPVAHAAGKLAFSAGEQGAYTFDTGVVRGTLCAGGKSSGLTSVVHVPSGTRLDGGSGICGYYRILATNRRYGKMAWDWPGQSRLRADGAVEIVLPATEERPFEMVAVYRWSGPATLDLETTVRSSEDLSKFEIFLASYFNKSLPSPYVYAQPEGGGQPGFLLVEKSHGDWLMFLRDKALVPMVRDGRWEKAPYPVTWTIMPEFARPLAVRRGAEPAPAVVLMAPPDDAFAIATPYQGEGHYSLYVSLFGHDIEAGGSATARTRFVVTTAGSDRQILASYDQYLKGLGDSD